MVLVVVVVVVLRGSRFRKLPDGLRREQVDRLLEPGEGKGARK